MRRMIGTVMCVVSLVTGCASGGGSGAAAPPSTPSVTTSSSAVQVSSLEGTWRTGTVSEGDIETTLRNADLEKWIQPLQRLPPDSRPAHSNVFNLEIGEGSWDLYWERDGGASEPLDFNAEYDVDGGSVVMRHADGTNTWAWSVAGDTLTLTWVGTTLAAYGGIPQEVFQRAFYTSGEFKKQG